MMKVFRLFSLAVLIGLLSGCLPIFVGQTGLAIYDLKYESNHRDQGNTFYICSNKLTTLTFSFGYSDLNKINGWEAQLVGVFTGATLPKLVQTRDGGGFRVVDNRIVVDWVLVEGVAPLSVVANPISQPNVVEATSLELLVRATDGGSVMLKFPGISVADNCQ